METKARYGCRDFLLDARGRGIWRKTVLSSKECLVHMDIYYLNKERTNIREEVLIDDLTPTARRIF